MTGPTLARSPTVVAPEQPRRRLDAGVPPDRHVGVDLRGPRVHDRHARQHVAVVDLRLGQLAHPRERRQIVDPEHEPYLLDDPGGDRKPVGA